MDLVSFLNTEAQTLGALQPPLTKSALRGHIRDRLAEGLPFPLEVEVRALVAGERWEGHGEGPVQHVAGSRLLELVPEGLTREAAALTGPLLWRTDRPLQAGSVVRARFTLEDPRLRSPTTPGLFGQAQDVVVVVAVEP